MKTNAVQSRRTRLVASLAATLLVASSAGACKRPVSYSAPVGIELRVASNDVAAGAIEVSKNITTESGNPYGAFVNDATSELGNTAPGSIDVTSLTIGIGDGSTGVTTLEEVFSGTVQILFEMGDTGARYEAGSATDPSGAGPLELDVTFDSDALAPADFDSLVSANFAVVLAAPAAPGFEALGGDANVEIVFLFEAFE